jgi:hypothetical protein
MSTDYSISALQIIDSSLRALGVLRSGDTVANDSVMQSDCLQSLNLLLKNFQNYGMEQWAITTHTFSNLTVNKGSYTLGTGGGTDVNIAVPERIIQAYVTPTANIDVECQIIGMQEYWSLANKMAAGQPNQVGYYFQNRTGTMYIWPVPSVNTMSLTIVYNKPYDDFDTVTDLPDVPQRWFEALKWNLVLRLAPEFGRPVTKEMQYLAQTGIDNAVAAGYEEASVYFQPDRRA